ncbi:MAG: DEAD/DEAH box helicase family protein [Nitrospira sp.]|nr:DEAD/DEAH box helicase family protein [Nitrospira sp.]
MFGPSTEFKLPPAKFGEQVDILSFVVTKAGWETLQHRLKLSPSNPVRILTRLIHKEAIDPINKAGAKWHYLENNHAKVILYRKQRLAVLGSFNLTKHSLGRNIECFSQVDSADYDRLEKEFNRLWRATKENDSAIKRTPDDLAQEMVTALDDGKEEEMKEDAPPCESELTEGPRPPWDFQEPIIQQVMDWLYTAQNDDLGRIVKLPTGAGKTLVAVEVIRRLLEQKPQARILWVCHRVELLRQSWKSVSRQLNDAIPPKACFVPQHVKSESGVRDRKEFRRSKECQVVFCTQGMLPHLLRYNRQVPFDLAVVDECHRFHRQSTIYRKLHTYCRTEGIPRLGLTATPLDPDKRNFGQYWNTGSMFGSSLTPEFLVGKGFLSRQHPKQWKTGFTFVCKKEHAGPEHVESELVTRVKEFNDPIVNREVEKAWQKYRGKRQRILCFAVTIEHAETLKSDHFANDASVRVAHSELTTEENRNNLEWFQDSDASETRMLVSVLMLAEGIDLPKTDCLFMVRPTFSPELYQQMIGRGLRGLKADGTEDCAIVDFTSQYVNRKGEFLPFRQVTANDENNMTVGVNGTVNDQDDQPDDVDASGRIWTVRDLKEEVADLQDEKQLTVLNACKELAHELDYSYRTLVNYLYTKPDDYPLGWEDQEVEPAVQSDDGDLAIGRPTEVNGKRTNTYKASANEPATSNGYVTQNKLLGLRACDLQRFDQIASLTNVASSTLRSYCSDQENFRRWRANNRDKMDQVLAILEESLARDDNAA